jgi:cytochrome c biogenesis protein ResB
MRKSFVVVSLFIVLCLLMAFLGINLIFCSWEKIFRIIRARFNGSKFFMLIVHAIFGLVALGHLGGLMLGYEHNNIQLGEGKKYSFGDGYEVQINSVNYVSDYKVLEKSSRYITRDEFDYRKNSADIVLRRNGKELRRENVFLLNPMDYKDIQVTLRGFMISPEAADKKAAVDLKPWITLTVSRNPALKIFLTLYPMMIAGIFIYLLLTWRSPSPLRDNMI